ncbi:hypothetical protein EV421DRAFT_422018 [Armillaria borealis]|uniref:MI domain-containing protein n=1 Tax=Armillaria borealis TaxID=47425 RepID=A0AA39K734_9AGAR|nr:hypothetical protein EV421DRAFT_422018 [Armillaria borealis]
MSKSAIATVPKIPAQLPTQSAWSRGPPQTASSSRSQSPAPQNTPTHATHSRRPSTLGQGIHIKDGVSIPRNNVGATKQGPAVSFGSIDDVSAPMSSSPAATPPIKSEGVKTFGTVPATVSQVNGKSSVSIAKPGSSSNTPHKPRKQDIAKLFQNPSSAPPSQASSDTSSPNVRPSNLPPSSQPPSIPSSSHPPYPSFVPQNGMRPQQPNAGPNGGATGSGPRSPQYQHQRQVPNGNAPRIPSGPGGPGAPQMSAGLGSPRMTPHPPPANMPPPMQTQMSWPPNYYYMGDQPYMYPWYPMQQHQMPPQPPQHHPQPPGGHVPPHNGIPVSPRNHPPPLQGPGTPTLTHAAPAPHPPHLPSTMSHSSSGSIGGLSSPPPTPSSASIPGTGRLNTSASAFVPGQRSSARVSLKNAEGKEINLDTLKNQKLSPALSGAALPPVVSPAHGSPKRRSVIRMESEEERSKRLAGEREKELAKAKAEADSKAKKEKEETERREKEEKEKKEKEARERKEKDEKERLEKEAKEKKEREAKAAKEKQEREAAEKKRQEEEAAEKERLKKEEEEKEKERLRLEEEERKKAEEETERKRLQQEQEEKEKERIRLEKEKEEKERARIAEEEAAKARTEAEATAAAAAAAAAAAKPEEGEVIEETSSADADVTVTSKDKAKEKDLRINTTSPPSELPRRRPGPLDLSTTKANIPAPLPSALATARIIDDLGRVPYPEGIKSPRVDLNINAKDGKFRYDRDFLLQFMSICKEKPESLPALDAIGLEPSDQINFPMSRGGSGRHRQGSGAVPPQRQNSTSLGFNPGSSFGKGGSSSTFSMGGMGNFATSIGGSKLNSDDRFNMSNNMRAVSGSAATPMPFGNRPSQMQRTASQGGPGGAPMGSNRTRSKRGEKRNDSNRVPTGPGSQHGYNMGHGSSAALAQSMMEPVAPLQQSANRWDRRQLGANDPDSPDVVDRKVKGLLNKLTMEKFDSISDQIIAWANKSEKEKDGRTLIQVIRLVFEKATDEATWSEMYARLCRKMMEQISPKVQDDGIKNAEGKPIAGGQLFRKYLLNRCQEDFERGWLAKEATATAAASKAVEDQAAKAAAEKKGDGEEEVALYSEEYYAAQKAKRQGLGLIKFIGELFKLQMLTERIMHECVKKLLGNVENPEEEEIESLCKLLTTVGQLLDTTKARAHMDVYFSRMKELTKSLNVSSRMQFMLQDILELRERKWISRNAVAAPTTIAQIHEAAAKEKAAQEKESYQRQMSMSRGGSRRGGERGEFPQVGADGWAVAGGNSAPRPPSKAGDLSKFGQISNKGAPLTFGPQSSIYAGKKDNKRESVQRTNSSSQNMFSMLNNDSTAEATPKEMLQRKRLVLAPRSKPVEGQENAPATAESEASSDEEVTAEPEPIEMSEKDAKKKIEEDIKEFSAVRNLDEAEVYFTQLPAKHHPLLVDKLISFAVESKEADAQLVSELFSRASTKNLCTIADFESGFAGVLEFLDDIAIDAPMAFKLMATMMKGPAFDDEQRTRLASKTDSAKLLGLLS